MKLFVYKRAEQHYYLQEVFCTWIWQVTKHFLPLNWKRKEGKTWFVKVIMSSAPNALEGDVLFGYQKMERLWEYNVLQVTV